MPHVIDVLTAGPWVLVLVLIVAGLDAILPFMPSESTVVAAGVVAAATGRPNLGLLIAAAALGAYAGDLLSYRIGRRSNRAVAARTARGRRAQLVHDWVHRMLHGRGGLIIVSARYVPGGRSTTAFSAGVVGYPLTRFHCYTGLGVLIWAVQAALLGYLGGAVFADRPLLGLALGCVGALALSGLVVAVYRLDRPSPVQRQARIVPSPRS
ncbi:DedA family protein [Actinoplanes sp. NPDC049599]|uniref:DedA family protein n=1 Tax=Actinoplanes sp. NPDC049599 TaxID=3363903 RepID=UPI0037922109